MLSVSVTTSNADEGGELALTFVVASTHASRRRREEAGLRAGDGPALVPGDRRRQHHARDAVARRLRRDDAIPRRRWRVRANAVARRDDAAFPVPRRLRLLSDVALHRRRLRWVSVHSRRRRVRWVSAPSTPSGGAYGGWSPSPAHGGAYGSSPTPAYGDSPSHGGIGTSSPTPFVPSYNGVLQLRLSDSSTLVKIPAGQTSFSRP